MLVLTRRPGEGIVITPEVRITVLEIRQGRVRLGISAPNSIQVDRAEVHLRRGEFTVTPRPGPQAGPAG